MDNNPGCVAKRSSCNLRHDRGRPVPIAAAAAAASAASAPFPSAPYSSSTEQDLAIDLDYVPSLGPLSELFCVIGPVLVVLAIYIATGRWHGGSVLAKLAGLVVAASGASLLRTVWLEREYKARERAHAALGDRDSRFRPIVAAAVATSASASGSRSRARSRASSSGSRAGSGGQHEPLVVHVKVKVGDVAALRSGSAQQPHTAGSRDAPGPSRDAASGGAHAAAAAAATGDAGAAGAAAPDPLCAVHCYHGFGANLESYKRVQGAMAEALRGVVTAHDMPGFGLTQRPSDMSSYFLTFNGRLGRLVLDYELQQLGLLPDAAAGGGVAEEGGASPAAPRPAPGGEGVQSMRTPPSASAAAAAAAGVGVNGDAVVVTVGSSSPSSSTPLSAAASTEEEEKDDSAPAVGAGGAALSGVPPPAIKRILMGHSLGGACAALEAVTDPDGLSGLVLVAPAVFALPGPEYGDVRLSPDRPSTTAAAAAAAASSSAGAAAGPSTPASAAAAAASAARAATQLGAEPPGSHVTDPPEVRRLYPVGHMPSHGADSTATGSSAGTGGGGRVRANGNGRRVGAVRRLLRTAGAAVAAVASLALLLVLRALTPVITLLLRSLVRRRTFWIKGLQQAYYNPAAVTPDIVDSYRLPQLVRGWEAGMVNFLLARLARPRAGLVTLFRDAFQGMSTAAAAAYSRGGGAAVGAAGIAAAAATADAESSALLQPLISEAPGSSPASPSSASSPSSDSPPSAAATAATADSSPSYADEDVDLASRLSALLSERRLPVLIVHGMYDRLVPASNSQRLARMLPGCELILLDRCGHMPQEEMPGLFVDLITEFAARLQQPAPQQQVA